MFRDTSSIYIRDTNSSASGSFDLAGAQVILHFPESIADKYKTEVISGCAEIINPEAGFRRYPLSVNNQTFDTKKLRIACGDGYAAFDPQTTTLTLHNAELTVGNTSCAAYAAFQYPWAGISTAYDDLTVVLEGENLLSGEYVNSASVNDRLSLTLTPDDAMALNAGSAETTLKELSFSLRLTAWGKAEIAVSSGFVSFNHMLIFDADGMLAENGTVYGGKTYVSSALPQGGYTAVAFNSNTRFSVFGSLDQMQTAGLVEGKDYAAASFRIQDDVTTTLSLTVPALTLPEAENAHRASISLYPGSVVLGKVFRVKVEYELAKALTGDLNITLPSDSEVVYVTEDNHVYQTEQVYNPKTHTVTVPVSDTKGSFFIGLYISDPGVHIINAALSAEGKVAPLSGLSFNPVAEVRVMAPQNTDADGFTAVLRGTANSTLTAELNGKHYMTVITNSAGTATMKVDIPSGTLNGEALTLRAYDSSGSDEVKVYYYQKNATQLISLSAQYYMGDVSFVKNGRRVGSPHYSITATDIGDWRTITAVLSGTPDELVTDDVKAQIMLSNGDFRTVNMTLTDSTDLGGETRYTFKGLYYQNGYLSAQTDWMPVPPPQLNIKTALISAEKPQIMTATAYPDYIELTFSQYMDTSKELAADGYTAEWTDTQLGPDGKQLPKTLRLVPEKGDLSVGEEVSLALSGAVFLIAELALSSHLCVRREHFSSFKIYQFLNEEKAVYLRRLIEMRSIL